MSDAEDFKVECVAVVRAAEGVLRRLWNLGIPHPRERGWRFCAHGPCGIFFASSLPSRRCAVGAVSSVASFQSSALLCHFCFVLLCSVHRAAVESFFPRPFCIVAWLESWYASHRRFSNGPSALGTFPIIMSLIFWLFFPNFGAYF